MEVIRIGNNVKIGSKKEIDAVIISLDIKKDDFVTYQVSWWDGQQRKTDWMTTDEMKYDPYNISVLKIEYT